MGNFITTVIGQRKHVDWETAKQVYIYDIQPYIDIIIISTIIITFVVFFRIFLSWFTKFFDEMIEGVNTLEDKDKNIHLSKELDFMEQKLNQIKKNMERSAELERELEKRKNDLIIYLAHDIKTPLTSVLGYLDLLEAIPNMPIEQRCQHIKITLDKAHRLEKLINEFFEIASYNSGDVPLDKKEINLNHMYLQISEEIQPLLEKNNKQLVINVEKNTKLIADGEKLARAFTNIIKNAINYGTDESLIEINVQKTHQTVEISIKNLGIISEKDLKTIFVKFYRADKARQTKTGGSGLGLAIAKDIVNLHGGTIKVDCDETHTVFTILLPLNGESENIQNFDRKECRVDQPIKPTYLNLRELFESNAKIIAILMVTMTLFVFYFNGAWQHGSRDVAMEIHQSNNQETISYRFVVETIIEKQQKLGRSDKEVETALFQIRDTRKYWLSNANDKDKSSILTTGKSHFSSFGGYGFSVNHKAFTLNETYELIFDYLKNKKNIPENKIYGYDISNCIDPKMTALYDTEDKGVANGYEKDNIFIAEYETSEEGVYNYLILVCNDGESEWKIIYDGLDY